jgi:hypothetical protein
MGGRIPHFCVAPVTVLRPLEEEERSDRQSCR